MRKTYIAAILILFGCINFAYAQETNSSNQDSWDYVINTFENDQPQVTEKQYNQAVQTIQSYQKKGKKGKDNSNQKEGKGKNGKNGKAAKKEAPTFDVPASRDPLLRLPADVYYNDEILNNGFYLVSAFFRNNKTYLRIKQGNQSIEVDAKDVTGNKTAMRKNYLYHVK